MIRVVILCAGKDEKWNKQSDVPKQMIVLNSEPLLYRTIRLLKENNITDILVSVREKDQFILPQGVNEFVNTKNDYDISCFTGVEELQPDICLFGDVYFSDDAIKKIVNGSENFYGRYGAGKVKRFNGEMFALKFSLLVWGAIYKLLEKRKRGDIQKPLQSWHIYRYMQGIPLYEHRINGNWCDIDDCTDDFDNLNELVKWKEVYE